MFLPSSHFTDENTDATSSSTSSTKADILREKHLNILRKFDVKMEYGPCSGKYVHLIQKGLTCQQLFI